MGGQAVLICVKVSFSSNNFFISQPVYFILTHIVALVKTFCKHAVLRP